MENKDSAGVVFPPPFIYLIFFIVGVFLNKIYPIKGLSEAIFRVLGLILVFIGIATARNALSVFRKNGTSIVPNKPSNKLVENGVYSLTRNPMYVANFIIYIGASFLFALVWPLIVSPFIFYLVDEYVIKKEEAYLERRFGKEYLTYKENVKRWL